MTHLHIITGITALLLLTLPFTQADAQSNLIMKKQSKRSLVQSAQSDSRQQPLPPPLVVDSTLTPEIPFTPMAVSMHNYTKKVNDSKESFILRNETSRYHISQVLLKIVYLTEKGETLHSREELVSCNLAPGETRLLTVRSFDTAKTYYYYTTPPKRASGTPYRIQYDILRYDVVVK